MADNVDIGLAEAIKGAGWWQGSILPEGSFNGDCPTGEESGWWVITSQTCNLYNPNFSKIPVFELVAAKKIDKLENAFSRGNNPRILHVEAIGNGETAYFEIDIQKRIWVNRARLVELGTPSYEIHDANRESNNWINRQWLDNFAGWVARSYTRVTLPDEFNYILQASRIQNTLDSKLRNNELYGIYFSISSAKDDEWTGNLGLMPPPYLLEILLVTDENISPEPYVAALRDQLFKAKVKIKGDTEVEQTRAEAAKKIGLRIVPAGVTGKSVAEITLLEVKSHIRYTLNDFLSHSSDQ